MNTTHLKAFRFSCAPELIKMFNPVVNSVQNDEGEKAVIQSFLKGFQHAVAVGVLHLGLILVLKDLRDRFFITSFTTVIFDTADWGRIYHFGIVVCQTHLVFDPPPSVWVFLHFLNLRHEVIVQNKNSWRCTATIDFLILKRVKTRLNSFHISICFVTKGNNRVIIREKTQTFKS